MRKRATWGAFSASQLSIMSTSRSVEARKMIPERVRYYPDQETVEINRSGNLTPDQEKVFRKFSTSLKVRQTVDRIIYNKKCNCYLLQKSDVEAGEVISSEGEWDGSLLPFIDYRIYYLGDEKG